MRSRRQWLAIPASTEDLIDVTNLIQDINAAHSARSATAAGCVLIAQILLARYSKDEVFAQAETWVYSDEVREDVRYNGAVGTVTLRNALDANRKHKPETPEERAQRFRRLEQEDQKNVREGLQRFADDIRSHTDTNQNAP